MKRMFLTTMLVAAICSVSFAGKLVSKGKTYSALGDYTIEQADQHVAVKGTDCKTYVIRYENSPMEVTVAVCKDNNCKRFVVLSDELSVKYVCNQNYFGVELLGREFEKDGFRTSESALNRGEYFHQKVLGAGEKTEVEATGLIAAFFPKLINPNTAATALK